ncbi:MAG: GtrA family protein [Flavobacteriales bacterium]|nr:GtrA family protein [Flavobacteriales bacterium]MCX7767444.1 GtrA family protein [Flavobacteriales bacterium]MDW8410042.1 GtrA family protein [Flavobacteriales bacterium]
MKHVARKFLKFGIVGSTGVVIDFAVTWLLKEKLHINAYMANSVGFVCAASNNWLLNRIWTFRNRNPQLIRQYLLFMLISVIGLGLNNLVVWFCSEVVGINFYLAKLAAVGVVMFWNFGANYKITFSAGRG